MRATAIINGQPHTFDGAAAEAINERDERIRELQSAMIKEAAYIVSERFHIEEKMSAFQVESLQEKFVECALRLKKAKNGGAE